MIQSFADDTTVDLFRECNTRHARRLPRHLWRVAQRKLKALDVAARLDDLRIPAGNRLERLKGTRSSSMNSSSRSACGSPRPRSSSASLRTASTKSYSEKRRITPDTALRLARLLKTSPQFWMRLQADWDLHRATERAAS